MLGRVVSRVDAILRSRAYQFTSLALLVVTSIPTIYFAVDVYDRLTPEHFDVLFYDSTTRAIEREARLEWPHGKDCAFLPNPGPEELSLAIEDGNELIYEGWDPDGDKVFRTVSRGTDGTLTTYTLTNLPDAETQLCRFVGDAPVAD